MAFGICCTVTSMAVIRVGGLLNYGGTGLLSALKVFVDAFDIDIEALCGLAKPFRVAIARFGTAQHGQSVSELHRGVTNPAVGSTHLHAVLSKSECFGQEF